MSSTGAWRMNINRRLKLFNLAIAWQQHARPSYRRNPFLIGLCVFLSFRSWGQIALYREWRKRKRKRRRPKGGPGGLSVKLARGETEGNGGILQSLPEEMRTVEVRRQGKKTRFCALWTKENLVGIEHLDENTFDIRRWKILLLQVIALTASEV